MQALTIVLLGGIASGKSAVAALFAERGATVFAADAIVHELLAEPAMKDALRGRFSGAVFDAHGAVDRAALAARVFEDSTDRSALEALLHPRVFAHMSEGLQSLAGAAPRAVAILDAPLAAETGLQAGADLTVYIEVEVATRIARAQSTRGWSAEELERRESCQMPIAEKRQLADYVINNNDSLEEARRDVGNIWREAIEPRIR
jgi:dephospho-CoA kinase